MSNKYILLGDRISCDGVYDHDDAGTPIFDKNNDSPEFLSIIEGTTPQQAFNDFVVYKDGFTDSFTNFIMFELAYDNPAISINYDQPKMEEK